MQYSVIHIENMPIKLYFYADFCGSASIFVGAKLQSPWGRSPKYVLIAVNRFLRGMFTVSCGSLRLRNDLYCVAWGVKLY